MLSTYKFLAAVKRGNIEEVKFLLTQRVDVNADDKHGTALGHAVREGYREIVELLLKHGADVSVTAADYNITVLYHAVCNGYTDIVKLLLKHGADVSDENCQNWREETALYVAAERGYKEIVESLLNHKKIDVNTKDCFGLTALHVAVNNNRKEIVKLLLKHEGIDVNAKDEYGHTALHIAASYGHVGIAKLLLDHKEIDVNAKDKYGHTALHIAAEKNHIEVVKLLLKHGVNTEDENVALRYAIINNQKEIMFLLLIYGAFLDEDSENEINKKPKLKECLIMLKEVKKMPNLGKLMEMNKNIEESTDLIFGFINDEYEKQELIREFETIKKRHPCERLLFILEYLLDFIKHIFLKFFTNKKVMATQLHESKDDIKVTTKDGTVLKNLPYEASEKIVSYFDSDTNKAVSLVLSKKVDAFLTKLKEAVSEIPKGSLTKVEVAVGPIKSNTKCCVV